MPREQRELPPPLEMMCLNALWEIGEGNVESVRKVLALERTLAYTTVLTLLDRLAGRGAVTRRKEGRGYRYQPSVERNKLRSLALKSFLEQHFEGCAVQLRQFLDETENRRTMGAAVGRGIAAGAGSAPPPE